MQNQTTYSITGVVSPLVVGRERLAFAAICLAFFTSRLLLLGTNEAEFTDGYLMIEWSASGPVRWHPLYPLLLKVPALLLDPVIAGRLVSTLAGTLALFPLAALARRLYGARATVPCCLFFAASPLMLWVNTRVLAESTFVLFALWATLYFIKFLTEQRNDAAPMFLFTSGLAMLARPEGVIFLPLAAVVVGALIRQKQSKALVLCLPGALPYALFLLWMMFFPVQHSYAEVMVQNISAIDMQPAFERFVHYLEILPYVSFYPLFVLAILGSIQQPGAEEWRKLSLYFLIAWLVVLTVHTAWSSRFLVFPVTLALIFAAGAFSRITVRWSPAGRNLLLCAITVASFMFALLALKLQAETFSDVKNAALYVQNNVPDGRVFSDEKIKTAYYLDRYIHIYDRKAVYRPGDILILHSFYRSLADEVSFLNAHYALEYIYQDESTTVPLLPGGLLRSSHFTNSTRAVGERFHKQRFQTVVLRIQR